MPKGEEGCVGSFESALFPEELQPESKRAIPSIVNLIRNTAEHLIPTMRQKSGDLHPYQRAGNYPANRISKPPKAFPLKRRRLPPPISNGLLPRNLKWSSCFLNQFLQNRAKEVNDAIKNKKAGAFCNSCLFPTFQPA